MPPTGEDVRAAAAMLAERADHRSVTTERLAGSADAVTGLRSPVVSHLRDGEQPKFCFESAPEGVGIGDEESTVVPDRGGVFVFTDLRVYLLLGVGDADKALSLPYESLTAPAEAHPGMDRHRIHLRTEETSYHLWVPASFDGDDAAQAAEYATYQHKRATPDTGGGQTPSEEPQTVEERLRRLGDAHSRGLISTEEFERRKQELKEYGE
ncbi:MULTISPECIES: SHOCT domain-containing protein [Halorussus]|uniref:SHOCT domain-containing protein n=1 Tax=Halorussus TaxID=1070314 RepID=UPI0020A1E7C0|nr:SHOCT domain-containing protein [Halorussus vallis]USZ75836.1 SHOCT domain-containing protein [Halorussus vallis]